MLRSGRSDIDGGSSCGSLGIAEAGDRLTLSGKFGCQRTREISDSHLNWTEEVA